MEDHKFIKRLSFFSGLQDDDLKKITEISVEKKYKKNTMVFMEGELGKAFYYIKSGKVKVFRTYEDGREHIIHILREGDVFGEATLFTNVPYPASALVYEDSVIASISNEDLEDLIRHNTDLSIKIIKILAEKLVFAQEKIKTLTFNDVFTRIASQLFRLAQHHGIKNHEGTAIKLNLSRQELAEMAGTTRETASRVISRFKKDGSLIEKPDMLIVNEEKLKEWI